MTTPPEPSAAGEPPAAPNSPTVRPIPVAGPVPAVADVLAPADLGPVRLRNRVIKSATFEGATPEGLVTDALIDYHRRPAAGGVGMTTVAYLAVSPEGRTERRQIHWRPEAVPGLRRLTDAVHAEGAAAAAQIGHAGPVADARSNRAPALSCAPMLNPVSMRRTRAATAADVDRITADHARAARLAIESGFDSVEIHLGHNYFASAFLSPRLNTRTDGYGGSLANRAKVALGLARAVRAEVGGRIAVTAKLNMEDGYPGGLRIEDSLQVARWLQEDGTLDALELTAGSSLMNPMYLFTGDVPLREFAANFPLPQRLGIRWFGKKFLRAYPYQDTYLMERARRFRAELDLPLILLGGITTRATMDRAMAAGFQYVAMARALLREPDLINRIAADPATPSRCSHCNRCMPTIYTGTRCPELEDLADAVE